MIIISTFLLCFLYLSGRLYIIMEYCRYGNLRSHLISSRQYYIDSANDLLKDVDAQETSDSSDHRAKLIDSLQDDQFFSNHLPLTIKDLICFAFQVARGMEYLESRKAGSDTWNSNFIQLDIHLGSFSSSQLYTTVSKKLPSGI